MRAALAADVRAEDRPTGAVFESRGGAPPTHHGKPQHAPVCPIP
jgi:hypothetical protein